MGKHHTYKSKNYGRINRRRFIQGDPVDDEPVRNVEELRQELENLHADGKRTRYIRGGRGTPVINHNRPAGLEG